MKYLLLYLLVMTACSGHPPPSWVRGRPGPTGSTGASGTPGVQGPTGSHGGAGTPGAGGAAGPAGMSGPTGAGGSSGADGVTGPTGAAGSTGADGRPGTPGSVVTPVVPCPLLAGSYPETLLCIDGTLYAVYDGDPAAVHYTAVPPGTYVTTDGRSCQFTVVQGCQID